MVFQNHLFYQFLYKTQVSHDFRLISQVAQEIWECKDSKVTKWQKGIMEYKAALIKSICVEVE